MHKGRASSFRRISEFEMSQPWKLRPVAAPSAELISAVGHPLVAQLLAQRGITTPQQAQAFLDPNAYTPAPPSALIGLDHAAQVLHDAIIRKQTILIWGDFDVDGQTSTALLVTALRQVAGDERVHFHVPNRFEESHGIRLPMLERKLAEITPPVDLLLTCDTGIAEAPAVGLAKDRGLTVVITDHHDLTSEFKALTPGVDPVWGVSAAEAGRESVRRADAIINPKFQPVGDALRTLPGVGVAFKLVQRLYDLCGIAGQENDLLDLVALGIVADVAEQVHDARYLLQRGLEQLRRTRRSGLLALMNVSRVVPASLSAESIGFQLGPRMNALGRLEDATIAIELLTTRDAIRAGQLAAKLERLNQDRRLLTSQTTAAALEMLERTPSLLDFDALVLAHPAWHAGVVGIVASKLVEQFGKPALLLLTPPGQPARGSARSVPGVDIGAAIAACSHLLISHGGHPGAAGVSLLPENIDRFRRELHSQIDLHRDAEAPSGLLIDAEASFSDLSLEMVEQVQRLAPFGSGNPMPQFLSRGLTVQDDRRMGREGNHRRLKVSQGEAPKLTVVWFHGADAELPSGPIDLVYSLNINEYQGERTLQLMFVAVRAAEQETLAVQPGARRALILHDLRRVGLGVEATLAQLPTPDQAGWYAEGALLEADQRGVGYAPRSALAAGQVRQLVVWSTPPSGELLHWLVETSGAQEVYLCGRSTHDDSLDGVLRNVAGMCKHALAHSGGRADVGRMAARLGLSETVIRSSLLWLVKRGVIHIERWLEGDALQLGAGARTAPPNDTAPADGEGEALLAAHEQGSEPLAVDSDPQVLLLEQLAEVRAYRRFFQRVKLEELGLGEGVNGKL
jgi:single-stranded-DNA-specific exonuclease